jgi:hypothetical protein
MENLLLRTKADHAIAEWARNNVFAAIILEQFRHRR